MKAITSVIETRKFIPYSFWILGLFVLTACDARTQTSNIKSDEQVVFFQTNAWFDKSTQQWHIPIHGWVFELENSVVRKKLIATVLKRKYQLKTNANTQANFDRRIHHLIADNERGKKLWIQIAGQKHRLSKSKPNGHTLTTLKIDAHIVESTSQGHQIEFQVILDDRDKRIFKGRANLVQPQGLSIISDIDDTIKISKVRDRKSLFEHTFYLDFMAVPGMAEIYQKWSEIGSAFHFVSSSPWQLYPDLLTLAQNAQFPDAAFHLKKVRFKDRTFFNLFKKGTETKPPQIRSILETFPKRQFILVGDSGEQDPEVYVQIYHEYPEQIRCIFIRNVTEETADNPRFKKLFSDIDNDRWLLFNNSEHIAQNNTQCLN